MTTTETDYVKAKTSVWWDIENCEVPRGWDAHAITKNVSSALPKLNYCGPVSISAYGDTTLIPLPVQQALSSTGVGLNHVPAGAKDASDKKILVDMLLWAIDNPAPANIMLISGDRDFSYALHQLRMRQYNILLAQPPHASVPLVSAAKTVWLWTGLASGCPPLSSAQSSLLLLNHGRSRVSNNQVSKTPVSEQALSSKPTDSTSVHKTKDNNDPGGLPRKTRRNKLQNGRGTTSASVTSCNVVSDSRQKSNVQLSDKSQISQAEFLATRASVSGKPIQIAELMEPVFCTVCQISCITKDAYKSHTYGKRHRNNLEQQSGKSVNMSVVCVEPPKDLLVKQMKKKNVASEGDHVCRMCNVVCQSQAVFDSHLRGQKHAAMLSQSEVLNDSKKLQEKCVGEKDQPKETVAQPKPNAYYVCRLCNVRCQNQIVFDSHLKGKKHVAMLLQSEVPTDSEKLQDKSVEEKDQTRETVAGTQLLSQKADKNTNCDERHVSMVNQSETLTEDENLHDKGVGEKDLPRETTSMSQLQFQKAEKDFECSEKHVSMVNQSEIQEKGLGEKDQPKERIAQPQSQSQNAQENSKCFEKHVVMALINSMKLEENAVLEMAQPIDTLLEPQSQSQNTQEHGMLLENQNKELREICGTSKGSGKDLVVTVNKQLPNGEIFFGDLRCDYDVSREARECCDGLVKPVNLFEEAADHSGEVKNKKKEVMVRQARLVASKLCQYCVVICDSRGLSTVVCDNKAHWPNILADFVARYDSQSNVSTKPIKEPEDVQAVWCQICQCSCNNKAAYAYHTYGEKHRLNLELLSTKNELMFMGKAKVFCKNQTAFDSHLKSQNQAAMVKVQAEALVDASRRTQQEFYQEKTREALEQAPTVMNSRKVQVKIDDLGFRWPHEDKEKLKEINATSENFVQRVFTEPNRESSITKEPRACVDVIPKRVEMPPVVNVTEKLDDETKHEPKPKSLEPENESTGRKEHPGASAKREEMKGQADNFWTRLWGKRS